MLSFLYINFSLLILPGGFLIGETITERFPAPEGFQKNQIGQNSFAEFLRNYPLKPQGSPVYHFDGSKKNKEVHVAVLDFPLLKKDLIQCADAIIKLRAEYLFGRGFYNQIKFKITNGMDVPFSEFAKGKRVRVRGNTTTWIEGKFKKGNNREVFDEYLFFIYSYAGTASLGKELVTVQPKDIKIGDLFFGSRFSWACCPCRRFSKKSINQRKNLSFSTELYAFSRYAYTKKF